MLYSENILPGKSPRHRASQKIMERSWIDPFSYHGIQGHGTRVIAKIVIFNLLTIKKTGPASLGLVWVTLTPFEWLRFHKGWSYFIRDFFLVKMIPISIFG